MKSKSIYLVYSHEYNVGYVGKSCNLKQRFDKHCSNNTSSVRQFCDKHNVRTRATFDIYFIKQCNATDASYYEGHIYDLIERHLPDITLINKNKPNRNPQESRKNWRNNNLEHARALSRKYYHDNREYRIAYSQQWRATNPNYHKQWIAQHPNYNKEYYMENKNRNK